MDKKGSLTEGLTDRSPPARDKSFDPKGGSVNDEATRKGVAPTPKTIGPRDA